MKKFIRWNLVFIVVGLPALWPAIETGAEPPSLQLGSGGDTDISDRELRTFAKAYAEIYGIVAAYKPSLTAPGDPRQVEKIMQEAEHQIEKLLEGHAFTADSFLKTARAISTDDELRQKTVAMINEERQKMRT